MSAKRILVWPPQGKPIEIYESDLNSFIMKGWTDKEPQPKKARSYKAEIETEEATEE
jgi:hypothetical protein